MYTISTTIQVYISSTIHFICILYKYQHSTKLYRKISQVTMPTATNEWHVFFPVELDNDFTFDFIACSDAAHTTCGT